jgi:carboxymethylenebutenolidase
MTTMTIKPYVHLVPVLTGEISYKNVYNFYKNHFIGKTSKDTKIIRISVLQINIKCRWFYFVLYT